MTFGDVVLAQEVRAMVDTKALRKIMIDHNNMPVSLLAKRIGKSPATVSRWLDSGVMPTIYAEAIADVLKVPRSERPAIFFNGVFPDKLQARVN